MTTKQVRRKSYRQSQPSFNAQEQRVIECVKSGVDNAWAIAERERMIITSVRRALTNLSQEKIGRKKNRKRMLEAFDTIYYAPTDRRISRYKLINATTQSIS